MAELSPALQELKRRFIVPVGTAVETRHVPQRRPRMSEYYYCPYAPCCSECVGVFTFREVLAHLIRRHEKVPAQIKEMLARGLPEVPERGQMR